jgi:hypothetical protein
MQNQQGEMKITVSKQQLLHTVKENRAKHRAVFLAALDGYRKEARRRLEEELKMLSAARAPGKITVILDQPQDHTRDYDRVIGMLDMHAGEMFTLGEKAYAQYVEDDWDWRRAWGQTVSAYTTDYLETYGEDDV